jgi:membrane-bound serine protease (ClpP class)
MRPRPFPSLRAAAVLALALLCLAPLRAQEAGRALLLEIDGAIGPGSADYLADGLAHAAETGAAIAVVRLDTPGGLDSATRGMVQAVLASPVPVAVWVGPAGARAASAGAILLTAAHVAAMAPGTATGAATPVQLGGGASSGDDGPSAAERKATEDAAAYIRGLAETRGRDPDWAERAVREAASASAAEALELGAIDLVADDPRDLLRRIDGRVVELPGGPARLDTAGVAVERFEPTWRHRLLSFLADPNVAYLLLLVGVYGLIFEFAAPGFGVGGLVAVLALPLGLYAMNLLPVDGVGLALAVLGLVLLAAEAFVPSFGLLGAAGLAAFVLGSAILFDADALPAGLPAFTLSPWVVGVSALLTAGFLLLVVRAAWRARGRPVATGGRGMLGASGVVVGWSGAEGVVRVRGERWAATADEPLREGASVRVRGRRGLRLDVDPADPPPEPEERR